MSKRPLPDGEMAILATCLRCTVSYTGKVVGKNRWDYIIEKGELSEGEKEVIIRSGLSIYMSSE